MPGVIRLLQSWHRLGARARIHNLMQALSIRTLHFGVPHHAVRAMLRFPNVVHPLLERRTDRNVDSATITAKELPAISKTDSRKT